jgi:hypothetical protein
VLVAAVVVVVEVALATKGEDSPPKPCFFRAVVRSVREACELAAVGWAWEEERVLKEEAGKGGDMST